MRKKSSSGKKYSLRKKASSGQAVHRQLAGEGLRPKKSLGQNFLTDESVLADIIAAADLNSESCVLEIGPGMGALTRGLAKAAGQVLAVEIDTSILPILEKNVAEFSNVTVINRDILKVDLKELLSASFGSQPVKVIANLPYYITTPIIMKLLEEGQNISSLVIMIQKEVADRLAASPGSKDYGAITPAVQYRAQVEKVREVAPESFHPIPKVWSSVIRLTLHDKPPVDLADEALFFRLIKAAFAQRRKTFLNSAGNTAALGVEKEELRRILKELQMDENLRGESLSLEQLAALANRISDKN